MTTTCPASSKCSNSLMMSGSGSQGEDYDDNHLLLVHLLSSRSERKRVVSLHCKGGKGRTGTMICAVLIDMGLFSNARDSLQYFGQRRTDLNVSQQFQGVETYSQVTTQQKQIFIWHRW